MAFSFDDEDPMEGYDETDPQQDQPEAEPLVPGQPSVEALETVAEEFEEQNDEEDYASALAQVDRRMAIANCYRSVLNNPLFDESYPEAKVVEKRIHKFIRGELEVLFGMKAAAPQAPASNQFSQEEVLVLKELIARLKKPTDPAAIKPRVMKMQAPPRPARVTQVAQRSPRPVSSVTPPVPQSQPKTAPKPAAPQAAKGVDPRIPLQYQEDVTAKVVGGKVYIQNRNADGELLWVSDKAKGRRPMYKDVTPTARPVGITPTAMPSYYQQNILAEQQASVKMNSLQRLATQIPAMGQVAGALVASLAQPQGPSSEGGDSYSRSEGTED